MEDGKVKSVEVLQKMLLKKENYLKTKDPLKGVYSVYSMFKDKLHKKVKVDKCRNLLEISSK